MGSQECAVDLVSLGNPHFSLRASCCTPSVRMIVTSGREVFEKARVAGHVAQLEEFGVQFVNDTCWCMLGEPVVPPDARTLMTNSGKYAHYAPGLVNRQVRFGSLPACVTAACS